MILNGTGGANTQSGKCFEIQTDLKSNLINLGINVSDVIFCNQRDFPKMMKAAGYNMKEIFGKEFWPDEAFIYNNHLYVIEKKYQSGNGSVDEKIQTGPYKKNIYDECARLLNLNGNSYMYLLSDYFNINKYTKHQIPYLLANGIEVYFENIPVEKLFA